MKQMIISLFFLFLIFGISNVYSQEFDNALFVVTSEAEPIIFSTQAKYSLDPDASSRIITFDESFTGTFEVKFPKSIPFKIQYDQDGSIYPDEQFILVDDEVVHYQYNENDCFFNYNMAVNNATRIEIIYFYALGLEIETISLDFEPYCLDIFESLKQVKEFRTCDYSHSPQFTSKVEQVCVYPESISKLTARGYLI